MSKRPEELTTRVAHIVSSNEGLMEIQHRNLTAPKILQACGEWLEDNLTRDAANVYLLIEALKAE